VDGVYAEVSGGLERVVTGRVPEVDPLAAAVVLSKSVAVDKDGRHYTREISRVGTKRKLLVGRPHTGDPSGSHS